MATPVNTSTVGEITEAAVHVQDDSVDERGLVAGEVDRGVRLSLTIRRQTSAGRPETYPRLIHRVSQMPL